MRAYVNRGKRMKNDKTDNHEQLFWEEIDRLFPDMIKAIASLSKKSYLSITNLRTGITWWSERAMDYFGMKENLRSAAWKRQTGRSILMMLPLSNVVLKNGLTEKSGYRMGIPDSGWRFLQPFQRHGACTL